jgi:hypothetical protein
MDKAELIKLLSEELSIDIELNEKYGYKDRYNKPLKELEITLRLDGEVIGYQNLFINSEFESHYKDSDGDPWRSSSW